MKYLILLAFLVGCNEPKPGTVKIDDNLFEIVHDHEADTSKIAEALCQDRAYTVAYVGNVYGTNTNKGKSIVVCTKRGE